MGSEVARHVSGGGGGLTLAGGAAAWLTAAPAYPLYLDPTWALPFKSGGTQHYAHVQGAPAGQNTGDHSEIRFYATAQPTG